MSAADGPIGRHPGGRLLGAPADGPSQGPPPRPSTARGAHQGKAPTLLRIGRRGVLRAASAGALMAACPVTAPRAAGPPVAGPPVAGPAHGFSPLGRLKYPPGFPAFAYVEPGAPKGGTLRLARTGAFDTANTLTYPGRPPGDLRLIYDRLLARSADETASWYGVLAETIAVAEDVSVIDLRLHPAAHWHDGRPVRAEDVAFTFETLKADGAPFYRQAFRTLTVRVEPPDRVVFENARPGDRDVIRRLAAMPIHPAHAWRGGPGADRPGGPLGSGPYRLVAIEPPRRLVLERVPDYWAAELGVNRGRWNFDRLVFDYYRSPDIALEAFLKDEHDLRVEDSVARWQRGYAGSALESGAIRRTESPPEDRGTLHGIVFNLRRAPLNDLRARLALTLAYDFDAVNRTLFGGAHKPWGSVFGDSALAAAGTAREAEKAVLAGPETAIPARWLMDPDPLAGLPPAGTRAAVAVAARLLDAAGLPVEDGRRLDPTTGAPFTLALVSIGPLYDRVLTWVGQAWERLGIGLQRVQADPAAAARRLLDRDFDLATLSWSPDRLPGTAERLLWHGALADSPRSYALSGIESPALDRAIEALEAARTEPALEAAARAFDRVFRRSVVMLPLWRDDTVRLAWWDRLERPAAAEQAGVAASPLDRWWARAG